MRENARGAAIVTGAARGIGRATAQELARRGHPVAVADRDAAGAEQAAAELRAAGFPALAVTMDVSQRESVERMVASVLAEHGAVEVLVNNAGIAGRTAPLAEVTDADWDEMMAIDLKS